MKKKIFSSDKDEIFQVRTLLQKYDNLLGILWQLKQAYHGVEL